MKGPGKSGKKERANMKKEERRKREEILAAPCIRRIYKELRPS